MNNKKILIVDDERDTLLIFEKQFTMAGYTVITAEDGESAVSLAKSEQPDLIVLDVQMPGMDGGETACKLKEEATTKEIPVIFSTCLLSDNEGYKCGGNVMLAKSKDTKELIAMVERILQADRKIGV